MLKRVQEETGKTRYETAGNLKSIVARIQQAKSDAVIRGHPMQPSIEGGRQPNKTTRSGDGFLYTWIAVITFVGDLLCLL